MWLLQLIRWLLNLLRGNMSDKILKIYDGGTGGTGSKAYNGNTTDALLKYVFQGELIDYQYVDNSNYEIDVFTASVASSTAVVDLGDIWRLFTKSGTLIGGGRIIKTTSDTTKTGGNPRKTLKLVGEDWTGILKDRNVVNYTAVAKGGDDIIKDILDTYFEVTNCDYNIGQAEIAAPTNNIDLSSNGQYAYDFIKDVAKASYGANSREFDFYIYESVVGTLKFRFFERQSLSAVVVNTSDIQTNGFEVYARGDINFNKVFVYGATENFNSCPSDKDWWTDQSSPEDFWTTTNGTISDDGTPHKVGSVSVKNNCDATAGMNMELFLDDAEAYNSATMSSDLFTRGYGYKLLDGFERNNQYLGFWLYCDTDSKDIYVALTGKVEGYAYFTSELPLGIYLDYSEDKWHYYEFNVGKCLTYDLETHCRVVGIYCDGAVSGNDFYIDGLHFYEKTGQCKGEYPTSPVAPIKELVFYDKSIVQNSVALAIATGFYTTYNSEYEGSFTLSKDNPLIKGGGTLTMNYQPMGISAKSLNVQKVIWRPSGQTVQVGRHRSRRELLTLIGAMVNKVGGQ